MGVGNDFYIASQYCPPHACLNADVKELIKIKEAKAQKGRGQD